MPPDETPVAPVASEPVNVPDVPIAVESETQEALDSNIDNILGIKSPVVVEDKKDEATPEKPIVEEDKGEERNDDTGDKSGDQRNVPDEKPSVGDDKPATPPEEIPTEVDTSDLWVEVENAEGEKIKISLEDGVPEDFTFKTDKQLYEVMDAMREMRDLKNDRESEVVTKQTEAEQAKVAEQAKETQLKTWDDELESLWDDELLDRPKAKPGSVNWEKDPAVQKADNIFKFMAENNKARIGEGKAPILSVAHNLQIMNNRDAKKQEDEKIKADNAVAKEKAALIGKQSAPSSTEKIYKAGSARSIYDVDLT